MTSFCKSQRLLKKSEYNTVYRQGQRIPNKSVFAYVLANSLPNARLGLSISKRCSPLAVQRNRIKRLVRESFRQQHNLPAIDIMVCASKHLPTMSNSEIFEALNALWQNCRQFQDA